MFARNFCYVPACASEFESTAGAGVHRIYQFNFVGVAFAAQNLPDWVCGLFNGDSKVPPIGHWLELTATGAETYRLFEFLDAVAAFGNIRIHLVL
jgi:hypothetical protein